MWQAQGSNRAASGRAAALGHMQSRIIAAERTHGPMLQVWTARGAAGRANPQKGTSMLVGWPLATGAMQQWEMRSCASGSTNTEPSGLAGSLLCVLLRWISGRQKQKLLAHGPVGDKATEGVIPPTFVLTRC